MRGLYLISNDDEFALLHAKLELALQSGVVALVQYRRKQVALAQQVAELEAISQLCHQHAVMLIVNDNLQLAHRFGCGLHLGQGDGSLTEARQQLGAQAIIGRTCHNSLQLAQQAVDEGASYLAFGAVFASMTKPAARQVSLAVLQQASQQFALPICAIGGLTVENSQPVLAAGVSLVAVVGDVLNLPVAEITPRLQAWQQRFQSIAVDQKLL